MRILIVPLTHLYNMGKKPTSDLRTNPISLHVHKYPLSEIQKQADTHWGIQNIQPFFPTLEKLFKTNELENPLSYGIQFTEQVQSIVAKDEIQTSAGRTQVHKKVSMILSPFKWIQEEYGKIGLPSTHEQAAKMYHKLQDPNNSVYIGSLFAALLSESGCPNFPKVYAIYSGTSASHTIDISDDYEELSERTWFSQNIGKMFHLGVADHVQHSSNFKHTRTAKLDLQLGEDTTLEGVEDLPIQSIHVTVGNIEHVLQEPIDDDNKSESSSVSTSYLFDVRSCDCEDEDIEDTDVNDEDDEEPFAWATFSNVPVQITVMEKCVDTFYSLCMANPDPVKHLAWMSQVIFALAFAQRNFGFVHNDLHANNIMYVSTSDEFIYYNLGGQFYKVPTYGYLIKIIDFERGTGSVKLQGMKDARFFMSDHFSLDEEAGGQYNTEPYYVQKFETVKPNASFDLCRLATSMFWDLFPLGPKHPDYMANPLFGLFLKWMTTEDKKSILFGHVVPRHDRYHSFHLYKAIARYCKNAVPKKELDIFKSYIVKSIPIGQQVCSIEG